MRTILALILVASRVADAGPQLRLDREPPPRTLKMRPRTVAQKPAPAPSARAPSAAPIDETTVALRDLSQRVSFSIDLGYQLDSAITSGKASLDSQPPAAGDPSNFDQFRAYGFGEVFGSTRGLGLASLSTYFALRFQAARHSLGSDALDPQQKLDATPPIATWFERSGVEARYGWAEMRDFMPRRWGLANVRVRAGGQHVYGPWIVHMDGLLVAYDGKVVTASLYSGLRHSDYTREAQQPDDRQTVFGASLRVDLRGLRRSLPLALSAELLGIGKSGDLGQPSSRSGLLQGDWRPRQDVAMIASVRTLDGKVASQRLEVRARYKEVTNLVLDLNRHTENDWRWDPALVAADTSDTTAARRYLDLGPVVPRFVGSLRAGTLIADNIDLLLRAAVSGNVTGDDTDVKSSYAAPYTEVGGAVEIRLRRTVALTASMLTRDTHREELIDPIMDLVGTTQALPASEYRGEEGFTELGASARLSLGARTFSTQVEVYGRRTRYAEVYVDPLLEIPVDDVRLGGRISLDAWVGRQLRLFAAYDVSSSFDFQPEINGYKSLRLMLTGVY